MAHKAVTSFRRSGEMDGNVGCYNNEATVQLTISYTSLRSGNRKFTKDSVVDFFLAYCLSENRFIKCTIKRAFKFILLIVLQKEKKIQRRNQKLADCITHAISVMKATD